MSTKKAYLMTLQEYLTQVVPVLKAYKDFLKKNKYFKQVSYGSLPEYSYPELVEAMKNKLRIGSMRLDFSEPELSYETHQQKLDRFWGSSTYNEAHLEKDPSADIINKKNEFVFKLKEYFGDDFFEHRMGEPDNTKTNKRAIKYAIEENIYKNLIEDGDCTISELSAIAESAGVKLPQNLVKLDTSYVLNNLYDAIYKSMPTINKDVLTKLVEEIKESFKPLETQIYDKEVARFTILIEDYAASTDKKDIGALFRSIPFVSKVLDYKTHTEYEGEGRKRREVSYAVNFQLLSGWQEQMRKFVKAFVDGLKAELVHSIVDSFEKITEPITGYDVEYLGMARTGTDFNGIIQFNFANGSHFTLNSRAISAGGYNIQCYHFRYISDYMDVTLADGSKFKNPSLAQIIEHFSDKQASQELFNPFLAVQRAENLDQIIEPLYTFAKTNGALSNVRMNKGKEDVSLSFKTDPWNNANKNRMFKHGIYLKMDIPLDKNKEKAALFLTENGAPQPTQFKSGGMTTDPREKAIAEYAKAHGVTKEFAATKVGDRKKIELPKELATGGDIIGDSAGIVLKKDGSWKPIDQLEQNAMESANQSEYSSGDWRTDFEMNPGYKKGGDVKKVFVVEYQTGSNNLPLTKEIVGNSEDDVRIHFGSLYPTSRKIINVYEKNDTNAASKLPYDDIKKARDVINELDPTLLPVVQLPVGDNKGYTIKRKSEFENGGDINGVDSASPAVVKKNPVITFNNEISIGDKFYYNGKKNFLSEVVDILNCFSSVSGEKVKTIYIARGLSGIATNEFEVNKVGIVRNRA